MIVGSSQLWNFFYCAAFLKQVSFLTLTFCSHFIPIPEYKYTVWRYEFSPVGGVDIQCRMNSTYKAAHSKFYKFS
jgi:hypothetical protein